MDWSPQQDDALMAVDRWLNDPGGDQVFRLFGYAGTGKTTLATHLAESVGDVLFGAFTGKAALVMRRKGCRKARTIHSLIYTMIDENNGEPLFALNDDSDVAGADLVIIDEVSMVDEILASDLMSFGTRILVLGDPEQLPPIKGTGYFTDAEPDAMLTEIHRQARENPIIRLSMMIREGDKLEPGDYGTARVLKKGQYGCEDVLAADQVLVGMNRTRQTYNSRIRELRGFAGSRMPVKGERLICLRNNRKKRLLNGGLWDVLHSRETKAGNYSLKILQDDARKGTKPRRVRVHPSFFDGTEGDVPWEELKGLEQFTFGYAVTVHKAQGSQWDNVFLFDESRVFRDSARRWLYTGVTRAAEQITIART